MKAVAVRTENHPVYVCTGIVRGIRDRFKTPNFRGSSLFRLPGDDRLHKRVVDRGVRVVVQLARGTGQDRERAVPVPPAPGQASPPPRARPASPGGG